MCLATIPLFDHLISMNELVCVSPLDDVLAAPGVLPFSCPGVKKGKKYRVLVDYPLMRSSQGKLRVLSFHKVEEAPPHEPPGVYLRRKAEGRVQEHRVLTATLCSGNKRAVAKAKPMELFDSARIRRYFKYCKEFGLPASILSRKYGVIPEEVEIFSYDGGPWKTITEQWVKVLSDARERYGIEKLYAWFDPSRGLPTGVVRAMEQVFPEAGATTHLIHLNRFLSYTPRKVTTFLSNPDFVSLCLTALPRASRIIELGSSDGTFTFALKTWKRCQVLSIDPNPWSYHLIRSSTTKGALQLPRNSKLNLFSKRSSDLSWLDSWLPTNAYTKGLLVRALLTLTEGNPTISNLKKVNPDECLSLVRLYHKEGKESARILPKRWSYSTILREIKEGDIILIRYFSLPSSFSNLNLLFSDTTTDTLPPKEFFRDLAKRLPSTLLLWYPHKSTTYNKVSKLLKDYFSQTSLISLNGFDLVIAR